MNIIEINGLTKTYGKSRGINDLKLDIAEGDFFGFIGPNGAGKSTTIRTLLGLITPTGGSAKIMGYDIVKDNKKILSEVGYLPSEINFYSKMKVKDVIKYSASLRKADCHDKAMSLCDRLGLDKSRNVDDLSLGNRKKVGIVCAVQHSPKLLILDEPTSGLDPNQVEDVRAIIREIGKTRTVIVSTHILSEVETICSRAIIISGGKLVADSSIEELKNSIGTSSTVYISVGGNVASAAELAKSVSGVSAVSTNSIEGGLSELVVSVNGDAEIRPALIKKLVEGGFDIYSAALSQNSLENVFHTLTEAK